MNKRDFKKKHKDYLTRHYFNGYIFWCNLYKRDKRFIREQKEGKHKKKICFIGISKYYLNWWKKQLFK